MRPLLLAIAVTVGCSTPPPETPVDEELQWNDLTTGMGCVVGKVACKPGNCAARIHNRCSTPVTCELTVQCICKASTGEEGEAIAQSRETILAGDHDGILAQVLCADRDIVATHAQRIRCN